MTAATPFFVAMAVAVVLAARTVWLRGGLLGGRGSFLFAAAAAAAVVVVGMGMVGVGMFFAFVFVMGYQWAIIVIMVGTMRFSYGDARFAFGMRMTTVPWFARITYAFVLFAGAIFLIARFCFRNAFVTGFARIVFAILFFAFAFQFVMMATVVTSVPFVFAALGRRRQFVFGASRR